MANYPPGGPYPSYYYLEPSYPSHHPFHPHPGYPPPGHPPPPGPALPPAHPYPYYVPGTVMVPVPIPPQANESNPTYITNYIYHGANEPSAPHQLSIQDEVKVIEFAGEYEWVPTTSTTAGYLTGRAVVGGHEGWDGSALWVIRSHQAGGLIPGKLSVRHNLATIPFQGKEVTVQNIEVLCAKPEHIRWVPATNGNVPPAAIPAGKTASGEQLYVGRARYQMSLTPGSVYPSHNCCYISFSGSQVMHKMYDVLCSAM